MSGTGSEPARLPRVLVQEERDVTERKSFDEQLEEAKADVVKLASRVGEQIQRATQSILDGDLAVVDTIYSEHTVIGAENREIEQRAYRIFALQQPIAVDLRMLLAVLRILHELELTAGLMRNVARATRRLYPRQASPRIRGSSSGWAGRPPCRCASQSTPSPTTTRVPPPRSPTWT